MKIDIGSGPRPPAGYVTLDCRGTPDILRNLDDTSAGELFRAIVTYQAVDLGLDSVDPVTHIRAYHVLEHIRNLCPLMDALHSVLAPGGTLEIVVPHKDSPTAWQDPTHVRFFVPETFYYFTDHKHFKYVEHYWKMIEKPSNLDAYNNPAEPGAPWCNIRVVLGKESA